MQEHEHACARVAALFPQRWLRHYASSKLRSDPVFRTAFELLRESTEPLLDVGCGVGLLPLYLRERGLQTAITGIDLDSRKIAIAAQIAERYTGLSFRVQNLADEQVAFCGSIAMFDVLHYLTPERQSQILQQIATCVSPGGVLLLRDSPREQSLRFCCTYAGEIFAQLTRWNLGMPLHFPTREFIADAFAPNEFAIEEVPTWGRTPFNNRLFIWRRRSHDGAR
jgi:2-polyprenyl-3-methyl-5-hydroxy-6-metoxy-1,4-benzoquinol methylase